MYNPSDPYRGYKFSKKEKSQIVDAILKSSPEIKRASAYRRLERYTTTKSGARKDRIPKSVKRATDRILQETRNEPSSSSPQDIPGFVYYFSEPVGEEYKIVTWADNRITDRSEALEECEYWQTGEGAEGVAMDTAGEGYVCEITCQYEPPGPRSILRKRKGPNESLFIKDDFPGAYHIVVLVAIRNTD